jgi:hypothetical protein
MLDYDVMNQIYIFFCKKITYCEKSKIKGYTGGKTALSDCELYTYEKNISLHFKQGHLNSVDCSE